MKTILLGLLIAILFVPSISLGRDYYIDPLNGNDSNDGSQASPKLNLSSTALRSALRPGDKIYLMDTAVYSGSQGFYTSANIGVDGTQENPITIVAAPGAHPVFKGCGQYGVYLTLGRQWYVVDGITFAVPDNPADCAQPVTVGVLIQNNYNVVRNSRMISLPSAGVRVDKADYNIIQNNAGTNIGNNGGGQGAGAFVVLRGGQYNIVQNNIINGAGHAAVDILDYPNLVRLSSHNQILNNTIDQGIGAGLNGGGGGIYVALQGEYNLIEGNIIRNIGQMVGITRNKAGIDIASGKNIVRNNRIESYGVAGSEIHRGLYVTSSSSGGFLNLHTNDNLIERTFIGAGYGLPLYIREGIGTRASGVTVANNIFRNNTITAPIENLSGSSLIGMYTPQGKYFIYIGSYTDGAWPVFANGNTFENTTFIGENGLIGYYYGTGGFGKSVEAAKRDYPDVFFDRFVPSPPRDLRIQ